MPEFIGSTTVSAREAASAASTALPPRRRMARPAWAASGWLVAIIPRAPKTGWRMLGYGAPA